MINDQIINEARRLMGAMLRDLREKKNIHPLQVAELLGVTEKTISKIEDGKFDFGIDILSKLSIVYGFTLNFELKEEGDTSRFVLQDSVDFENYIVTDTINGIVCKFKKGDFNGSQKFTFLNDPPTNLPTVMRELGDWLAIEHQNLL